VLPILPALAASSPVRAGTLTGFLDTRLEMYRHNADRVPSVVGALVPEPVFSRSEYENRLLAPIYRDLEPFDTEGLLRHEWVNARGAIARFDRDTIEIRILDVQECPGADVAIAGATASVVRALVSGDLAGASDQRAWPEHVLSGFLESTVRMGEEAPIVNSDYLALFGYPGASATALDLWRHLIARVVAKDPVYPEWKGHLEVFEREGCLARRLRDDLGEHPGPETLRRVYGKLAYCLEEGRSFSDRA
jgi:carboxylate-amine ligase